ncbi:hypothetical protein CCACVL1_18101 [Corchorus capsularis]|uniref:Hydrophobin n=1 Tax=Corchorus capsularis TaxID=210143 RepID=A0A1R3HN21_COCAP|nr:hypothetical protein CCACVL1_18101 [Corchorus capsularis]
MAILLAALVTLTASQSCLPGGTSCASTNKPCCTAKETQRLIEVSSV